MNQSAKMLRLLVCLFCLPLFANVAQLYAQAAPRIKIWYGSEQSFGRIGTPQQWVNILGNVSDPNGVAYISYSLNGGPDSLISIGPDTRRLLSPGDFNIEIDRSILNVGRNRVDIKAADVNDNIANETVYIDYATGIEWPKTYAVKWDTVTNAGDVLYILDGEWSWDQDGIRPTKMGYDRTLVIGDIFWQFYEMQIKVTLHNIDTGGFVWPSVNPGFGITMRWQGHTYSNGSTGSQPRWGWEPNGANIWYGYSDPNDLTAVFSNLGGEQYNDAYDPVPLIEFETVYNFKIRVEKDNIYRFKMWKDGASEPTVWGVEHAEPPYDLGFGSMVLVAHHTDVTFGDFSIRPLDDDVPFAINDLAIAAQQTSASIGFSTDQPAKSSIKYGLDTGYLGGELSSGRLATDHLFDIPALAPETEYHFMITLEDENGGVTRSNDLTFTTLGEPADETPPVISNLQIEKNRQTATITWMTDEPAIFEFEYGLSQDYELGKISGAQLRTDHDIELQDLQFKTTYYYKLSVHDSLGNTSKALVSSFRTNSEPGDIVSDQFTNATLDEDVWVFTNPMGDADIAIEDAQLVFSVAGGTAHQFWGAASVPFENTAPRLMQDIQDVDFEVEVKLDSGILGVGQQGIVVEHGPLTMMRFEFAGDGENTYVFAASIIDGVGESRVFQPIGPVGKAPLYMRVNRKRDRWMQFYSFDGENWQQSGTFYAALTAQAIGLFVGNDQGFAQMAYFDHFVKVDDPLVPVGVEQREEAVTDFSLHQNYPNPFNGATAIEFDLPQSGHVRLTIYNLVGQATRQLVNHELSAGRHTVMWHGETDAGGQAPSGVYYAVVRSGDHVRRVKMTLVE